MCAAVGSVAEKMERNRGGRKTETGRDRKFCAGSGGGNRRSQISGISGSKNRASAGASVRRAGDGTALSDFLTTGGLEPLTELLRPDSGEGDRTYVLDAEVGNEKS